MKYLKKFNESNSEWYEKISYDDYMEWISSNGSYGKPSGFTDNEVSVIKSCLSKTDRFQLFTNGPASNNPKGEIILIGLSPYGKWYNKKVKSSLTISKYSDEWFLCQVDDLFYKCDTIEGLTQLIKDKHPSILMENVVLNTEYYENITLDDLLYVITNRKADVFSKADIESIVENIDKVKNEYYLPKSRHDQVLCITRCCSKSYNDYGWIYRMNIYKYEDEWFYFHFEKIIGKQHKDNSYYKCDGSEGVVKLIDKLIYNK